MVIVTSAGASAVAYVKARANAHAEADVGYAALKIAVEEQGKAIEQMQRAESEWHGLVSTLLAEHNRPTVSAPMLQQLRRPSATFAPKALPENFDALIHQSK